MCALRVIYVNFNFVSLQLPSNKTLALFRIDLLRLATVSIVLAQEKNRRQSYFRELQKRLLMVLKSAQALQLLDQSL